MSQFNFVDPFSGSAADGTSGIAGNLQAGAQRDFQAGQNAADRMQQADLHKQSLEAQLKVVKAQQEFQAVEAEKQRQAETQSQQSSQQFQGQQNTQAQNAAMAQKQAEIQAQQAAIAAQNKRQDELEKRAEELRARQAEATQRLIASTAKDREMAAREVEENNLALQQNRVDMTEALTKAEGYGQSLTKETHNAMQQVETLTTGFLTAASNQHIAADTGITTALGDLADPAVRNQIFNVPVFKDTFQNGLFGSPNRGRLNYEGQKLLDEKYKQGEFDTAKIQSNLALHIGMHIGNQLSKSVGDGVDVSLKVQKITGLLSDISNATDPEVKKAAAAQAQTLVKEIEKDSGGKITAYSLQQAFLGATNALSDAKDLKSLSLRMKNAQALQGKTLSDAVFDFDGKEDQKKIGEKIRDNTAGVEKSLRAGLGSVFNSSIVESPDELKTAITYRIATAAHLDPAVPPGLKATYRSLAVNTQAIGILRNLEDSLKTTSDNSYAANARLEELKKKREALEKKTLDLNAKVRAGTEEMLLKINPREMMLDPTAMMALGNPMGARK